MTSPLPVWWGVVFGGLAFAGFSVHDALARVKGHGLNVF